MLIMLTVDIEKPEGMSNKDFFEVWRKESVAAMEAYKAGAIKNIYKVAGKYQIMAIMEVDDGDQMDEIIHSLPIWSLGYAHIAKNITWTALRPYENWAKQLEELARG